MHQTGANCPGCFSSGFLPRFWVEVRRSWTSVTVEVLAPKREYFWSAIQFWEVTFALALEALQNWTPRGLRLRFEVWDVEDWEFGICIVVAWILIFAPLQM